MKKTIITLAIILMAGTVYAGDPNSMPNPTAWNRITTVRDGNITTIKIWTPKKDQQIFVDDSWFPGVIEKVIYRSMPNWIKQLFDSYNSDMNLPESKVARTKRDTERIQ